MKTPLKTFALLIVIPVLSSALLAQSRRPITFDDLISIKRVSDAQISPDGQQVAYVVNDIDKQANRGKRSIWVVPALGGTPKELITSPRSDDTPRWSRDGKQIAFLSSRDGAPQIFVANAEGSNQRKVTNVPEGVADFIWSPDGKMFAFSTAIYPECKDLKCVGEKAEAAEQSKVKAVVADHLLFRHWDSFRRGKRSHLFVVSADARPESGEPLDLTPGNHDVPPFSLGDPTAYDFSPDSQEVVFARNTDKIEAISTNNDLFIVPVRGGEAKRITGNNAGSDTTPRYSPDGRWIAYRSQVRNGYESDRFRLMLYDRKTGTSKELSTGFDRWVGELSWSPDSQNIFIVAEDRGRELFGVASINGGIKPIMTNTASNGITISGDGKIIAFTRSSMTMPTEVFKANADGSGAAQLTRTNANLMGQLDLNPAEDFEYVGAQKRKVHGFIVKPPQFDKSKKYPMILLIHGGPQGAWLDNWGFRWNPQMWAARGYVTVLINPHGSTGYGQALTEQISGDWGGAVYEDLMKGVDHVIKQGYIDPARLGAAGGSYGGYMVNWILGHSDRFKALVSHAGVYNLTSMYGATEELWFTEWEFKGNPWDNPQLYEKWSPHLYARNFKTPTLVVHGELDYRVPVGEGLQLFTTLQRRGVPSRLLYYPDEGHWILKPQNSELWYKTVLDWFDQWLKPGGMTATR
jgi:dipeptidyl aminopeptidase/acylaminoacyl peptidase